MSRKQSHPRGNASDKAKSSADDKPTRRVVQATPNDKAPAATDSDADTSTESGLDPYDN